MRAFTVFFAFFALFAMAAARGVHFVDNNPSDPTAVKFVNNNPSDPTAVNVVNNNPSDPTAVNFVGNNPIAVHVVDNAPGQVILNNPDPAFSQPDQSTGILNNPDPAFGRPTYEQPAIPPCSGPNIRPPRYPIKQYDNPYARGGK